MLDFIDYNNKTTTLIMHDACIDGDIISSDAIEVYGRINGNVHSDGLLSVYGKIYGKCDIKDLIVRNKAFVQGDCDIFFDSQVESSGQIIGNVKCRNIEIRGYVRGNISAEDNVVIRQGGNVDGDIVCQNLVVDKGGIINGNVKLAYRY